MILLGWEIGTGKRVEIPETGHLAWFGQTQLSGKTTALEAIAYRGELRAVAFITKQGEGGFLTGRMIPPYFSEPTNDEEQPLWRWVKSILEASQQRKLNFEEAWIIRCCEDPRSAKTLKDVHENIKALLGGEGGYIEKGRGKKKKKEWKYTRKPVSGINAGVYTSLKAYFDIVMPQLARLPYTKKLALGDGLNVMDLREYAMETQALVIRSVMEWVYQHEKGVRVIVPEAQDFVPQGKNSPVKMACETLVRKAGANKNFMWLDSQDMAAVDKIMLRACSIVGIGVQTEGHEIERSLAGLFTPALKPVDIARLKIGEFFVRTPEAKVSKVYVQPAWMESELHAQAIAKGEERVESARQMLRAFKDARGQGRKDAGKPHQLLQVQIQEPPDVQETETSPESNGDSIVAGTQRDEARTGNEPLNSGSGASGAVRDPVWFDAEIQEEAEKIPSPILNESEPGKHEETTQPGDTRIAGSPERTESASETAPIHEAVLGTSVRSQRGANAPGSEGAMPDKETPAEALTQLLDSRTLDIPRWFKEPLRDLLKDHAVLIEAHDALAKEVVRLRNVITARGDTSQKAQQIIYDTANDALAKHPVTEHESQITSHAPNGHGLRFTVPDLDYIYGYVKSRAAVDPTILEILTHRPEIRVKVERQVIHAKGDTMDGRLALLIHEGFFDKPRDRGAVGAELRRRGALADKANLKILSPYLAKLTSYGFLTREGDAYKSVPEMKAQIAKA
jgi:hypothetical protein